MKLLHRLKRQFVAGLKPLRRMPRPILTALVILGSLMNLSVVPTFAATSTLVATGLTFPHGGLVLQGTAIDPATGQPVKHYWTPDHLRGICRMDPDPVNPGKMVINDNTCVLFVFGAQTKPGQLDFDPANNFLYASDLSAKSIGVYRLHYLPNGDFGQGAIDILNMALVGQGCGLDGVGADTARLGPDGNLYVGFKRSGNIQRILQPQRNSVPCGDIQTIGKSVDKTTFEMGFIGNDLWGASNFSMWIMQNATACSAALPCQAASILAAQVVSPLSLTTDQHYPAKTGSRVYVGNATQVYQVDPLFGNVSVYGTGFAFVSGLSVDMTNPAQPVLLAADDPTNGFGVGQGRLWTISDAPMAPTAPSAPTGVTATAGDASATVSWTPGSMGSQPITKYTIHVLTAAGAATAIPDVVVTAPAGSTSVPTTATVTGVSNGTSYEFTVQATNSVGTSSASAPSNIVTPQKASAPSAPTGVSAVAGNAQASVAWTAPASNGGSAITGYTITALVNNNPVGITATAPGNATGAIVSGLKNGTTYTFVVHATNAVGNSPESTPSNAVTPAAASADLAVSVSGPTSGQVGQNASYNLVVTNAGPSSVSSVVLTANLPATGASVVSNTTTQGVCSLAGATLTCNLASMAAGASATVAVTLNPSATGTLTVSGSVTGKDAAGATMLDPNPANNTGSVSTTIGGIATPSTTTDIQVTGSASNGGPAVGSSIVYTWQVKNGGSQTANAVKFTDILPSTLNFISVSSSLGTCTGPAIGSAGGTVSCDLSSLPVGQTMVVSVNVMVNTLGTIGNTGSATFSGTDSKPANDSFTVNIQSK